MNRLTWVLIPRRGRIHSPICLHSVVYKIRQLFYLPDSLCARFEVLTAVLVRIWVVWDVTLCH